MQCVFRLFVHLFTSLPYVTVAYADIISLYDHVMKLYGFTWINTTGTLPIIVGSHSLCNWVDVTEEKSFQIKAFLIYVFYITILIMRNMHAH